MAVPSRTLFSHARNLHPTTRVFFFFFRFEMGTHTELTARAMSLFSLFSSSSFAYSPVEKNCLDFPRLYRHWHRRLAILSWEAKIFFFSNKKEKYGRVKGVPSGSTDEGHVVVPLFFFSLFVSPLWTYHYIIKASSHPARCCVGINDRRGNTNKHITQGKKKGSINVGHPLEDFLKNAKPVNLKKRKFLRM